MTVMPAPGARDAPKFDEEKPTELLRFISRMEDLFAQHSITADEEKVKTLGKYTTAETESEWQALEAYGSKKWADFKKELIQSYPEAATLERGSRGRLDRICKEKGGRGAITRADLSILLSLKRAFTAEAEKLLKAPALLSNIELVNAFVNCLSNDFAKRLSDKLDTLADTKKLQGNGNADARTEDRFTWKEVIATAVNIAENNSQPFNRHISWSEAQDESSGTHSVKIEEDLARMQDTLKISDQRSVNFERQMQQQSQRMEQLLNAVNKARSPQLPGQGYATGPMASTGYSRNNAYNSAGGYGNRTAQSDNCFYCKETGHRISECPWAHQHMDLNWVKRVGDKLRLIDGNPLPYDGVKSSRELVEAISKPKPGLIPSNKVLLQSVTQDDEFEQFTQTGVDSRVTHMIDHMTQLYGRETIEGLLNTVSPRGPLDGLVEDVERTPNF